MSEKGENLINFLSSRLSFRLQVRIRAIFENIAESSAKGKQQEVVQQCNLEKQV